MSSEERIKILKMVEDGKISAAEAANLMRALAADEDPSEEEMEVFQSEPSTGFEGSGPTSAPEFDEVKRRARNLAMIPLWVGVVVAVLSAWGLYSVQQSAGMNFWFFCLMLPLFLGVLLIVLGAGGGSKWLYVNVDRRNSQDGPKNITLGFPLPLGLTAWFLRTFGHSIQGLKETNVDDIIQVLNVTSTTSEPLIVNVQDGGNGEHVQVYIG